MTVEKLIIKRPGAVLAAAMMSIVLVTVDLSVVNVAAPALCAAFGVNLVGVEWALNIYTLAYASFLLNAGALSDRYGPRSAFMAGFVLFTLSSVACGFAPTFKVLLISRLVQGLGAALLAPSALALLQLAFPDRSARARAIGLWAGAGSFALAGGPVVGGALIGLLGWRSVFLINLPIGLAGLRLAHRQAPRLGRKVAARPDVIGQLAALAAVTALTVSVTEVGALGWFNPVVPSTAPSMMSVSITPGETAFERMLGAGSGARTDGR